VILHKLHYYRDSGSDRHLRDVALMSRVSSDALDRGELERWVARLGLSTEWAAAEAFPV
jgi:hypothetical protein